MNTEKLSKALNEQMTEVFTPLKVLSFFIRLSDAGIALDQRIIGEEWERKTDGVWDVNTEYRIHTEQLARCPCGERPRTLTLKFPEGNHPTATPDCCDDWRIILSTTPAYYSHEVLMMKAKSAWNNLARADDLVRDDEQRGTSISELVAILAEISPSSRINEIGNVLWAVLQADKGVRLEQSLINHYQWIPMDSLNVWNETTNYRIRKDNPLLNQCPCGQIPQFLTVEKIYNRKFISPSCCDRWCLEMDEGVYGRGSEDKQAIELWNDTNRSYT